jgi:hypothetical protein
VGTLSFAPPVRHIGTFASTDIALAEGKTLAAHAASVEVTDATFVKPISNFYQIDPLSSACLWLPLPFHLFLNLNVNLASSMTMAQCT